MTRRYLALGDSYTIGEGVAPADRWPMQLARLLRDRGVPVEDPCIIARTGWRTNELAAAVANQAPPGPFDLVTLLIGVNDQYNGAAVETYSQAFAAILDTAVALAGGIPARVVVLSIPDWGTTPFAAREGRDPARVAREIEAFNAASRDKTSARGARFVDVTRVSGRAAVEGGLLVADGLHPSRDLYTEWTRLALEPALAALRA